MSQDMKIGTRSSALALKQAHMVQGLLAERGVKTELVQFTTTGDKRLDEPLSEIGAKGLFTKELEVALARGTIDCAVHSFKDLPTESPPGLTIVAVLPREDPRDVLVVGRLFDALSLDDVPHGSRVGTSSLRRRAQLKALRPDLEVVELRGNVPTRLRKVDEGQVHAAILAAAGLIRLGATQHITAFLEPPVWLPAAAQGIIAIQARADDARAHDALVPLSHLPSFLDATAERAFLAALEGGCQVPIGALVMDGTLHGVISDTDGRRILRGQTTVDPLDPAASGRQLAAVLRADGADAILKSLRHPSIRLPAPQPE